MSRASWINASCALLCMLAATWSLSWVQDPSNAQADMEQAPQDSLAKPSNRFSALPWDLEKKALIDATGIAIPFGEYQRIVLASIRARSIVGEIYPANRIAAVLSFGLDRALDAHRFSEIPTITSEKEIEKIVELMPDLVIVNAQAQSGALAQLRRAGLNVFALGEMGGVESFEHDLRVLAALLNRAASGERIARSFRRQLRSLAQDISPQKKKSALYLSDYGGKRFGGTRGTSFHDVLHYAGLIDVAAKRYQAWPQLSDSQILEMNPEVIVGAPGLAKALCTGQLLQLQACKLQNAIVELPSEIISDPNFAILEAAGQLREAVYGLPSGDRQ